MVRAKKVPPLAFVLDALEGLNYRTNPMFGCLAVYVGDKIMLILRDKGRGDTDNGLWLATVPEHHASLQADFPSMRSIRIFGPGPTGWQVLPADADDFESAALHACELVRRSDPRIGKVPASRKKRLSPRKQGALKPPSRKSGISAQRKRK